MRRVVMEHAFNVTVHGVKVKWQGATSWNRDDALHVAKQYLDQGFHLIEIRDVDSQKIEVLWTIRDKT